MAFPNSNQQGRVTGSLGEFRETVNDPRFHRGNDFKADNNDEANTERSVHAVNEGIIDYAITSSPYSTYVRVGGQNGVYYYHIQPDSQIVSGTVRNAVVGTYLGEMLTQGINAHVHLQQNNTNFLNNHISPFRDDHEPEFVTTHLTENDGIELYRNGIRSTTTNYTSLRLDETTTIDGEDYYHVYNKIDIAAHIRDEKTNTLGNGAGGEISPFFLSWKVSDLQSNELIKDSIVYDHPTAAHNDQAEFVFHPSSIINQQAYRSINIITSDPYETNQNLMDQFWNTALRIGQIETFEIRPNERNLILDAPLNDMAIVKDGRNILEVSGCDVDSDQNNPSNCEDKEVNLLVDNFKPYVKRLEINYSGNGTNYSSTYTGRWSWQNEQLDFIATGDPTVSPADYVEFRVTFSEPLSTDPGFEPSVQVSGLPNPVPMTSLTADRELFVFTLPSGSYPLDGSENGTKIITINGYDLAHNQITGFETDDNFFIADDLPVRVNQDTWEGHLASRADTRHVLHMGGSGCLPPGGRAASGFCPLIADFRHATDVSNPNRVLFTDLSVPGDEITAWQWDFGDGSPYSSAQNPSHTYSFTGDYPVSLTVSRGTEEDTRTVTINVTNDPLLAAFTASTNSGKTPLIVDFNSSASVGNITSLSWQISPASGFQYVIGNSSSENNSVRFDGTGTYTVTLTIRDGINQASASQDIQVISSHEPSVSFDWGGNIYAGTPEQFFSEVLFDCSSDFTYAWTFEDAFPQTDFQTNPLVTFNSEGVKNVGLCVTDACGTQKCFTDQVTVLNPGDANADLVSNFHFEGGIPVPNPEDRLGYEIHFEKNDQVTFLDRSTDRSKINAWTWWFQLPLGHDRTTPHPGPSTSYESYTSSVSHQYNTPGKFLVRLYVYEDIGFQGAMHDRIIVIRRPPSFCEEETLVKDRTYAFGERLNEIGGDLSLSGLFNGVYSDIVAENGSDVNILAQRVSIKSRTHFHPGSRVQIKTGDCDEIRSTFEN